MVLAFGLFFVIHPSASLDVLAKVFGSLFVIEGAANLIKVFIVCCYTDSQAMLGVYFLSFACNTTIGILIFLHPSETANLLLIFIASWFIAIGSLQLCLGCVFQASNATGAAVFIGGVGLLYVILGILLLTNMDEGVTTIVRLIGVVVTLFGIQLACVGCKLKTMVPEPEPEYNSSEYTSIIIEEPNKEEARVSDVV